jgi:hypothetical protein
VDAVRAIFEIVAKWGEKGYKASSEKIHFPLTTINKPDIQL